MAYGVMDILTALGLNTALAKFDATAVRKRHGEMHARFQTRLNDTLKTEPTDTIEEYEVSIRIKEWNLTGLSLILGGVGYGSSTKFVLTRFVLRQVNNVMPNLVLTVHTHPVKDTNAAHHARAWTVLLPALDWGVNAVMAVDALPDELNSATFEGAVQHVDEPDRTGKKWQIGASHDCVLTETLECEAGADLGALEDGWIEDPQDDDEGNTKFATEVHKYLKYPAADE